MGDRSESKPNVLYVLQDFPVLSERFVEREIIGLRNLGARVRIVTLRHHRTPGANGPQDGSVWSPPAWGSLRFWKSWLRATIAISARPRAAAGLLALAWSLGSEASRFRAFQAIRWLPLVAGAADELACDPPSVIHAHFASRPATVAWLLGFWLERPWGFSVHAHDFYAESVRLTEKVGETAHVFACSETLADDVRSRLPAALHDRVHTVFHGIDLEFWRADAKPPPGDTPIVLGVGRFEPKKGFALLVLACEILRNTGFPIRCQLIGDGAERQRLTQLIEARGMDEIVDLLPWCSPRELRRHYRRASVLAVPSVIASDGDRDNFPNVVIEALACQLPVVAAALPAMQEALGRKSAGVLFQPGDATALADALRATCIDTALKDRLRERGLRLVRERWDIRSTSRQIFDLLA